MLTKRILKIITDPISSEEVKRISLSSPKIMLYSDLKYGISQEVIERGVVVLYQSDENPHFGHWTLIFSYPGNKTIEFFDPYGLYPDDELDWYRRKVHPSMLEILDHFSQAGYQIEMSPYKFQKHTIRVKSDSYPTSTCGRHCALRLLLREFQIDAYALIFQTCGAELDSQASDITVAYITTNWFNQSYEPLSQIINHLIKNKFITKEKQ